MTGLTDYFAQAMLNDLSGALAMPALPTGEWLALFTAVGVDAGTGFTECSGNGYARVQVAGSATTNGTTAAGNATLHFASTPSWIVAGMSVTDLTTPSVIPASTTVLSTTGTTVVMSANATGGGVGGTDSIRFTAFSPSSGSAPSQVVNNGAITFPAATGGGSGFGTVIAFGLYDASTVGNLLAWDYMGSFSWLPATVSSASPGVLTAKAHGYSVADTVVFSTEYGGTAPSFSQSNFSGLLAVAHAATDTFDVTNAATAVNTSSTGSGMVRKVTQQQIPSGVTASFAASALTITAA